MTGDDDADSIMGHAGELVSRFISLVDQCVQADPDFPVSPVLQAIGVAEPVGAVPTAWELDRAGMRMLDLINGGVDEAFLVRAMRDAIGREVAARLVVFPAMFDEAKVRRLADRIDSPAGLAWLRSLMSVPDDQTDDEFREELRELLVALGPVPAEAIAAVHAIDRQWRELSTAVLGDEVIGTWIGERP